MPNYDFNRLIANQDPLPRIIGPRERELRRGKPYRLRLGANESQFGPSPAAISALAAGGKYTSEYCDPTHSLLRQTAAGLWGVSMSHIAVGEGVEGLLEVFSRTFLNPGDVVVSSRGTYPTLAYYVRGLGAGMALRPYSADMSIDIAGLISSAWERQAKLVYLANPDNPTGRVLPFSEIIDLLQSLPPTCMLLLDEAYAEFSAELDNSIKTSENLPSNLIRLRSFSKAYGLAGARVGYAIAHPDVISMAEHVRQRYGVSKLSQEMAVAALSEDGFVKSVRDQNSEAISHYRQIAEILGAVPLPSAANFVAFDFGTSERASHVALWCESNDILVMKPEDPVLTTLVRITTAPAAERAILEEILLALPIMRELDPQLTN